MSHHMSTKAALSLGIAGLLTGSLLSAGSSGDGTTVALMIRALDTPGRLVTERPRGYRRAMRRLRPQ